MDSMIRDKLRCGVVGIGHLGKLHVQKYLSLSQAKLIAIADINEEAFDALPLPSSVKKYSSYEKLIGQVDAVSIATPTYSHFEVAKFFLQSGVHVLVEKPIATTLAEAQELIEIANSKHLVLQVGHVERLNPVFRALNRMIIEPFAIEARRFCPFRQRNLDMNVILDLMICDLDIIQTLIDSPIEKISARGAVVVSDKIDVANVQLKFLNGCVADISASRINKTSERNMKIKQKNSQHKANFLNHSITTFHKEDNQLFPGITRMVCRKQTFENIDPLRDQIAGFLAAIKLDGRPLVSGEDGKRALDIAIQVTEIIQEQLDNSGNIVGIKEFY